MFDFIRTSKEKINNVEKVENAFKTSAFDKLIILSKDKVPNVRRNVAQTLLCASNIFLILLFGFFSLFLLDLFNNACNLIYFNYIMICIVLYLFSVPDHREVAEPLLCELSADKDKDVKDVISHFEFSADNAMQVE